MKCPQHHTGHLISYRLINHPFCEFYGLQYCPLAFSILLINSQALNLHLQRQLCLSHLQRELFQHRFKATPRNTIHVGRIFRRLKSLINIQIINSGNSRRLSDSAKAWYIRNALDSFDLNGLSTLPAVVLHGMDFYNQLLISPASRLQAYKQPKAVWGYVLIELHGWNSGISFIIVNAWPIRLTCFRFELHSHRGETVFPSSALPEIALSPFSATTYIFAWSFGPALCKCGSHYWQFLPLLGVLETASLTTASKENKDSGNLKFSFILIL